jgi:hypothetical protein
LIISEKQVFEIYVPFIESPFKFAVQIIPEYKKYEKIEEEFQEFYEINENTDQSLFYGSIIPSIDEFCMSKFKDPISSSETWYRAQVKGMSIEYSYLKNNRLFFNIFLLKKSFQIMN